MTFSNGRESPGTSAFQRRVKWKNGGFGDKQYNMDHMSMSYIQGIILCINFCESCVMAQNRG